MSLTLVLFKYQDELLAELDELDDYELMDQLLQPATTVPAASLPVPTGRLPIRPVTQKNSSEEDEIAALQAEMAM